MNKPKPKSPRGPGEPAGVTTTKPASLRGAAKRPAAGLDASPSAVSDSVGTLSIGDLAGEFGITTRTIRFYEARGLLLPARAGQNRIYSRRDRARLQLILRGKNLGFSIEDIAEYLSLYDTDPAQRLQTRLLLDKLEARITELRQKRTDLDRTLRELDAIRDQCLEHLEAG